jgi:hypothetical protein
MSTVILQTLNRSNWPLIFKLTRRLLPPEAAVAVEGMAHDAEAQVHDPEAHTRKEVL